MCKYATPYKPQFVCFKCRRTFKYNPIKVHTPANSKAIDTEHIKCPQCYESMVFMGSKFKIPKVADDKAWSILESQFEKKKTLHPCGCSRIGYLPKDNDLLIIYLRDLKTLFEDNRHYWSRALTRIPASALARKMKRLSMGTIEEFKKISMVNDISIPKYAIAFWNKKIEEIEEQLQILKQAS